MAVFVADAASDVDCALGLEGTGPGPVALLLAILTVVFVDALNLHIVAVEQFLELLVLLAVEYLLHLLHALLELVVIVSNDDDMQRLVVLKDVLLRLVGPSAAHCDLAAGALLDEFLGLSARTDDLADVVGLGVADCVFGEIDLLELLEGAVVLGRHEGLPHAHAVLDQRDALPDEVVPSAHLPRVDALARVVVDGLGTGRAEIGVVGAVVAHLGGELIEPI